MSNNSTKKNNRDCEINSFTDLIILLEHSVSMKIMGDEPIQAINSFINEQKINSVDDESTFTLATLGINYEIIIDHVRIKELSNIDETQYNPKGVSVKNDLICSFIDRETRKFNTNKKIVLIVTDGEDKASKHLSLDDTLNMISDCQENHNWEFIFVWSNINVFASENIKVSKSIEFSQYVEGDLHRTLQEISYYISSVYNVDLNRHSILPISRSRAISIEDIMKYQSLMT
jgi:hypothetical protein